MRQLRNLFKNFVVDTCKIYVQVCILLLFTTTSAFSQVEDVRRIVEKLCSPSFHGRGYVNGGDSIAAQYIAQQFQEIGLQQISDSYFQRFKFPVNTFPGNASFFIADKKLEVGTDIIVDPASPSYRGVLKYEVIQPRDIFELESIMPKLQKAIQDNEVNCLAINMVGVHPDTLTIIRNFKYELAQFIPVIIITDQKMNWSVDKKQIENPIFELNHSLANKEPIQVNLDAVLKKEHTAKNVIGYLPAQKKTKKTIVFTAHYDHLGRLGQDVYFPGANDNASGTGMMIALAKYFKQNPISYNLLFIAFAGEEAGLLGSKYYTENPLLPLSDITFLLNLDIFGSGEESITVVNGSIHEEHFNLLVEINNEKQLINQIKARGYAANSDHYWFSDAGVPAFFIYTSGPNRHYHDPFDKYENLSFAEVNDLKTLISLFIERLHTIKIKKKKH
ncbi:MAG TPA: M28 family peptidase [Taishania sp.]|nr:M28 family peptidase [Taishania sp.]